MVDSSQAIETVNSFIAGINFNEPTWDLFIILFLILGAFMYGLTLGRDRIILVLISTYMALAVMNAAPFLDQFAPVDYGPNNVFTFRIIVFLGVFIILFVLLSRSSLMRSLGRSESRGAWWQVIVFSVMHIGLMVSIILKLVPVEFHEQLSPITRQWFTGQQAEFFWLIGPIIALAFAGGGDDGGE
jgi:hypothetical protein|tara:strand:+ start:142 stop:699 length:558 start_codon:yes stop_codon:yes gene_type:complete